MTDVVMGDYLVQVDPEETNRIYLTVRNIVVCVNATHEGVIIDLLDDDDIGTEDEPAPVLDTMACLYPSQEEEDDG
jgi:hypothetical protein